ncbi:unnamed protein product [Didymodactylos carnosus]|uniref:Dienelactone hydrolase domain-containing protein n=1 Tax=Didymodactylos carnosus TaxID=1234261 RepID=A0A8S2FE71_9BILA|nr:unnamed protein product [Didymodactylos carnosus]CAF4233883.1 unnamed protein product [Didymodactylos carnosus]
MASGTTEGKLDACCLTEYRPLPGTPSGQIIKIAGIDTYHVLGKDETSKGKAIVLLTDVFGLTKNPCMTADEVSDKSGFDVYVPDLFNGDPIASSLLKDMPEVPGENFVGKFVTSIGPWLFNHRQAVTVPIVEKFLQALRSEKAVTRIEAVGYCFGGLHAMLLGGSKLHLVDAIVGCHVSRTTKAHFEELQVPAAFACAQEDNQFSDAFRAEAEQILAHKPEIPSKFLVTHGTVHGFASRPNPDNPVIMKAYTQANDLIVEWAKAHL